MKLTILTDNNQAPNSKLLFEHGLSFYIEESGKKILFDTGYSDIFIKNSESLGVDLLDLDYIVLSHGHYDHTWGLALYLSFYMNALKKNIVKKKPIILTHPSTFLEKYEEGVGEVGSILTVEKLRKSFEVILVDEPYNITDNLVFLGEIPSLNGFEIKEPMDKVLVDGEYQDDYIIEDSALVYNSDYGLSIITGCSHSGICNIVEYSQILFKKKEINTIIGGLHLIDTPKEKMDKIVEYLKKQNIKTISPCHCTDDNAKKELAKHINSKPIGVGSVLTI